jgi:hypothetical protein
MGNNKHDMCISEETVKGIVHAELKPVEADIKSARNWVVGFMMAIILTMFSIGVWVGSIENRVVSVTQQHDRLQSSVENRLQRIEDLLLELTKEVSRK